ncbi:MAG: tetratricopeptide repeat protein [Planctomycetes bacterium]|nr:tetratricopeptide repeat protein [Planctomycetota bacterium]
MANTSLLLSLPPVPEFIGREAELKALGEAVEGGSNSSLVLITGEPGVGRSRLFWRWLESAPQYQALAVTAPRPGGIPGGLASEILRSWAEPLGAAEDTQKFLEAADNLAQSCANFSCGRELRAGKYFLARLAGLEPNDERERSLSRQGYFGELISGLRSLLECHSRNLKAADKRLVLFLDDVDHADKSSRDLLDGCLQGFAAEQRPLVVATSHLDDGTGAGLSSLAMGRIALPVGPFTEAAQDKFITRMLRGGKLPERLNDTLWRRSGGNALGIEQQLRLLVAHGILKSGSDGRWSIAEGVGSAGSTKSLPALIADVLRGLPGPTLQAVVAASATGMRAKRHHIAAVLRELGGDTNELDRHCVRLVRQGVLRPLATPDGDWVFRHPLMYEACSLVMPAADQQQFHRAVLNAIGPFASVSGLRLCGAAFNQALQGKVYDEALNWAWRCVRTAGQMGLTQGVVEVCERAMPLFSRVADSPANIANKAELVIAAGRVWVYVGDYSRAMQSHAMLPPDRVLSRELYARTLQFRAELGSANGRFPQVGAQLDELLQGIDGNSLMAGDLNLSLGGVVRRQGNWARAREYYTRAREIYDAHKKLREAVECLQLAAAAYRSDNQLREAEMLLDEALHLNQEIGDRADLARTMITLGMMHGHRGDLKACEDAFRNAQELALAVGDYLRVDQAMTNLAICRKFRGFGDEARQIFRELIERSRKLSQWARVIACLINLAELDVLEGNFDTAIQYLNEARARAENTGALFVLPTVLITLLGAQVAARRFYDARQLVDEVKKTAHERGQAEVEAMAWTHEGEICSAANDLPGAKACFDKALEVLDDYLALGRTVDEMLRADVTSRYAWFLIQHELDLQDRKLIPEGPRRRAAELLKGAEVELRDRVQKGFETRRKDLDRVMDLLAGLQV